MTSPPRTPSLAEVVGVLEELYPLAAAQEWDRVGLVAGDPAAPVASVLLAVDPAPEVAADALAAGADLLLVHHPLLLRPVSSVAATTPKGRVVHDLVRGGVALYTAHTNADAARPGVSDALARVLGLTDLAPLDPAPAPASDKVVVTAPHEAAAAVLRAAWDAGAGAAGEYRDAAWTSSGTGTFTPSERARPALGSAGVRTDVPETRVELLVPRARRAAVLAAVRAAHPYEEPAVDVLEQAEQPGTTGIGRVGVLAEAMPLKSFADHVATVLPGTAGGVRVAGDPDALVRRVAVCGGAGDSLLAAARASGADAFVTADLRHHPAAEAREATAPAAEGAAARSMALVDVAHWASEWPWLHGAAERLVAALAARGATCSTTVSTRCTDPWTFAVPSPGGTSR